MMGHKGLAHKLLQVFYFNRMYQTQPGFNKMLFYLSRTITDSNQFTKRIPSNDSSYLERGEDCYVLKCWLAVPKQVVLVPVFTCLLEADSEPPLSGGEPSLLALPPSRRRPRKGTLLLTKLPQSSRGIKVKQEEKQQQLGSTSCRMKTRLRSKSESI